jgi:regulator of RNase E activity RraA
MPTRIHAPAPRTIDRATTLAWGAVPTTIAADLLKGRTLVDTALRPLRPFGPGRRLAGPAVTAGCEPLDYGPVHHAIAEAGPGDVIVVDAGGRPEAAMIGELLSGSARLKGIAGIVVDGPVRDIATLASWPDFLVLSRGHTARGPSSMDRGTVNAPVTLGGVPVTPGDLILADDDGIVVLTPEDARAHLEAALAMVRAEEGWDAQLASGLTTLDVFNVPEAERA